MQIIFLPVILFLQDIMKHTGTERLPLNLCSWVYLCILVQFTISAKLHMPLPTSQIDEDSGKDSTEKLKKADTEMLVSQFTAANDREPTDQTTPEIHVENESDASDFASVTAMKSPLLLTANVGPVPASVSTHFSAPSGSENPPRVKNAYPDDLFSLDERRQGWVILHIVGMLYTFLALVVVCNEFFVPAVKVITDKLAISDDVAGATVMAAGRSIPKFFAFLIVAVFGHSEVGISTIVGPAVYNIFFVIGMCAFFSREIIHLTWRLFFRDMSFYVFLLILIIVFFLDNVIMWWESMILLFGYTFYVTFLKFDAQFERLFRTHLCKQENLVKFIAVKQVETDDVPAGDNESRGSEDSGTHRGKKNSDGCCKNGNDRNESKEEKEQEEEEATQDKPLSLKWPDTHRERAAYLFLLPIVLPLWLTLPDVRNQKSRRFFVITFLASILWIGVLMYFVLWFGHQVGETVGIPPHIVFILIGGIANPDLITSVIVARKGLGDMAVSSAVGSNIFDITVGLPVPWLLFISIHGSASVAVTSNGLVCASVMLFLMLLFAIILMPSCKWRMNKVLGSMMILLYIIFLVISCLLQYQIIVCPVSV